MTEQELRDIIKAETNTRRVKHLAQNATKMVGEAGARVYGFACERLEELQKQNIRPLRSSMSSWGKYRRKNEN